MPKMSLNVTIAPAARVRAGRLEEGWYCPLNSKKRFLTINSIVRRYQIETTRTGHLLEDEIDLHDAQMVRDFAEAVRQGFPEARITWGCSWQALTDQSPRYREIRETLADLHHRFGDDVTFAPGGFFTNVYNSKDQVNRDITDALKIIDGFIPGYQPQSLICGFLSAENIRYAREKHGIIAVQGNIWSQYSIDGQDGDGSISYPYYPSQEHFCKPAQGQADFIDCLNFDGWTVDFIAGRLAGEYTTNGVRYVSRMGVGPIETLHTFGVETGLKQMQATTRVHFDEPNLSKNPFGWITNNYEIGEANRWRPKGCLEGFSRWIGWIKETWPDAECPTLAEFARTIRGEHPTNDTLRYRFDQTGTGLGASFADQEVRWYMNKQFRLGLLKQGGQEYVFDYADYTRHYQEPTRTGQRNWTLWGEINQKQTRPQDKPVPLDRFKPWPELQKQL